MTIEWRLRQHLSASRRNPLAHLGRRAERAHTLHNPETGEVNLPAIGPDRESTVILSRPRRRLMTPRPACAFAATMVLLIGAGGARPSEAAPRDAFWKRVSALCGRSYRGVVVEAPAGDTTFAGKELVMHVRECGADSIRIPFHVGTNRSRTWVLTRTRAGLRLKHDHRHEDGTEDSLTQYGGDARLPGEPGRMEFPADGFTAKRIPRAATNVWTVAVVPGRRFVYALRREGTERRFRIEFDLTTPVPSPPPPWGAGP